MRPADMPEHIRIDVDLGMDVFVRFTTYMREHHPDCPDRAGGILIHRRTENPSGWCEGAFNWWRPAADAAAGKPTWTLHSLEPLDLTPSFLCHCGFHGFIRQGRWVPA